MSDKRKNLETILAKLQKLLPHLGDANANEAANALQKINNLLATVGLDWHDLMALMQDKQPSLLEMLAKLLEKDEERLVRLGIAGAEFFYSGAANAANAAFADVVIDGQTD